MGCGNRLFISCLLLVGISALSKAQEAATATGQPDNSNQEQNSVEKDIIVPPSYPSDLIPHFGTLATGATVAVGVAAVFFIFAAAWPLLNVRACSMFGTCGTDYGTYNSVGTAYNNDAYTYAQPPYTSTSYQKRSISRRRRNIH